MSDPTASEPLVADITVRRQPQPAPTGFSLLVDGVRLTRFVTVQIARSLKDICGSFELEYLDDARASLVQGLMATAPDDPPVVTPGRRIQAYHDGELLLAGWIEAVSIEQEADNLRTRVTGRDAVCDLVDCAAAPTGPAEFVNVDLLAVATAICKPFGIKVRADSDVGAPFARLAVGPHEKAMDLLEKAGRQRSILVVSDGVGGLLLTSSGVTPAPAAIAVGVNAQRATAELSWARRYSDVYVKGQTDARSRRAGRKPMFTHDDDGAELGGDDAPIAAEAAPSDEASTVLMTGHATDPEIDRYRPTVRLTRSQSGMSTTQEQAEWAVRVERGLSRPLTYRVLGWRAGPYLDLWRPNATTPVYDPIAGIDETMLIDGVTYGYGPEGETAELSMVGVTAYDRINEADRRRARHPRRRRATPTGRDISAELDED